mmetsp:Transcript_10894/g.12434  ORF Transcript_10894/g.12434 Transcript_10894/m.12434 type:complete len:1942 (+) Transcript_10894:390-6215(+)
MTVATTIHRTQQISNHHRLVNLHNHSMVLTTSSPTIMGSHADGRGSPASLDVNVASSSLSSSSSSGPPNATRDLLVSTVSTFSGAPIIPSSPVEHEHEQRFVSESQVFCKDNNNGDERTSAVVDTDDHSQRNHLDQLIEVLEYNIQIQTHLWNEFEERNHENQHVIILDEERIVGTVEVCITLEQIAVYHTSNFMNDDDCDERRNCSTSHWHDALRYYQQCVDLYKTLLTRLEEMEEEEEVNGISWDRLNFKDGAGSEGENITLSTIASTATDDKIPGPDDKDTSVLTDVSVYDPTMLVPHVSHDEASVIVDISGVNVIEWTNKIRTAVGSIEHCMGHIYTQLMQDEEESDNFCEEKDNAGEAIGCFNRALDAFYLCCHDEEELDKTADAGLASTNNVQQHERIVETLTSLSHLYHTSRQYHSSILCYNRIIHTLTSQTDAASRNDDGASDKGNITVQAAVAQQRLQHQVAHIHILYGHAANNLANSFLNNNSCGTDNGGSSSLSLVTPDGIRQAMLLYHKAYECYHSAIVNICLQQPSEVYDDFADGETKGVRRSISGITRNEANNQLFSKGLKILQAYKKNVKGNIDICQELLIHKQGEIGAGCGSGAAAGVANRLMGYNPEMTPIMGSVLEKVFEESDEEDNSQPEEEIIDDHNADHAVDNDHIFGSTVNGPLHKSKNDIVDGGSTNATRNHLYTSRTPLKYISNEDTDGVTQDKEERHQELSQINALGSDIKNCSDIEIPPEPGEKKPFRPDRQVSGSSSSKSRKTNKLKELARSDNMNSKSNVNDQHHRPIIPGFSPTKASSLNILQQTSSLEAPPSQINSPASRWRNKLISFPSHRNRAKEVSTSTASNNGGVDVVDEDSISYITFDSIDVAPLRRSIRQISGSELSASSIASSQKNYGECRQVVNAVLSDVSPLLKSGNNSSCSLISVEKSIVTSPTSPKGSLQVESCINLGTRNVLGTWRPTMTAIDMSSSSHNQSLRSLIAFTTESSSSSRSFLAASNFSNNVEQQDKCDRASVLRTNQCPSSDKNVNIVSPSPALGVSRSTLSASIRRRLSFQGRDQSTSALHLSSSSSGLPNHDISTIESNVSVLAREDNNGTKSDAVIDNKNSTEEQKFDRLLEQMGAVNNEAEEPIEVNGSSEAVCNSSGRFKILPLTSRKSKRKLLLPRGAVNKSCSDLASTQLGVNPILSKEGLIGTKVEGIWSNSSKNSHCKTTNLQNLKSDIDSACRKGASGKWTEKANRYARKEKWTEAIRCYTETLHGLYKHFHECGTSDIDSSVSGSNFETYSNEGTGPTKPINKMSLDNDPNIVTIYFIALTLSNLGQAHQSKHEHDTAMQYFTESLRVCYLTYKCTLSCEKNLLADTAPISKEISFSTKRQDKDLSVPFTSSSLYSSLLLSKIVATLKQIGGLLLLMHDIGDDSRIIADALNYYARALYIQENMLHLNDDDLQVAETLAGIAEVYREMDGDNELLGKIEEINACNKISSNSSGVCIGDYADSPLSQSKRKAQNGLLPQDRPVGERKNIGNDGNEPCFVFDVPTLFRIANALIIKGQYDSSIKFFSEVLNRHGNTVDGNHPDIARSMDGIGVVTRFKGDYEVALRYHQDALRMFRAKTGKDCNQLDVAKCLSHIGEVCMLNYQYESAASHLGDAIASQKFIRGLRDPLVAMTLRSQGVLYKLQYKYDAALASIQDALSIQINCLSNDHPEILITRFQQGQLLCTIGNFKKSIDIFCDVLGKQRKVLLVPDHPSIGHTLHGLGTALARKGDLIEAMKCYIESYRILASTHGGAHPDVGHVLNSMGECHMLRKNYDKAQVAFEEALQLFVAALGDDHVDAAFTTIRLGVVYAFKSRCDEAEKLLEDARINLRATWRNDEPPMADLIVQLGQIHMRKFEYDAAVESFDEALRIYRLVLKEDHPNITRAIDFIKRARHEELLSV